MECSNKDLLPRLQCHNWERNSKGIQRVSGLLDTFLAPGLSGHLNNFWLSWEKIWDDPALPTQAKPQPGRPVTRSNFIPLRSNCYRVLTVKFSPFLGHFGSCSAILLSIFGRYWPFLALLGQNWGLGTHPHSQLGRSLSQDI